MDKCVEEAKGNSPEAWNCQKWNTAQLMEAQKCSSFTSKWEHFGNENAVAANLHHQLTELLASVAIFESWKLDSLTVQLQLFVVPKLVHHQLSFEKQPDCLLLQFTKLLAWPVGHWQESQCHQQLVPLLSPLLTAFVLVMPEQRLVTRKWQVDFQLHCHSCKHCTNDGQHGSCCWVMEVAAVMMLLMKQATGQQSGGSMLPCQPLILLAMPLWWLSCQINSTATVTKHAVAVELTQLDEAARF